MRIHKFAEFINESKGENSTLRNIASAIITSTNYPKEDLYYERDNFVRQLRGLGFSETDKITPAILAKHPEFHELSHKLQTIIASKAGMGGKSPNNAFVKEFATAFHKFPVNNPDGKEKDEYLLTLIHIKKMLDEDTYPDYTWLNYDDAKKLRATMYGSEMRQKLTDEEFKFLQKLTKPKYEELVKHGLTDEKISKVIMWAFDKFAPKTDDNKQFLKGIHLMKEMPELFNDIKEKLMNLGSGGGVKDDEWKSLDVKLKFDKSSHSAVVSSSFTNYYYHIDAAFAGKHYTKESVQLSSSHFSGGWD
jgi:hypothetical protein